MPRTKRAARRLPPLPHQVFVSRAGSSAAAIRRCLALLQIDTRAVGTAAKIPPWRPPVAADRPAALVAEVIGLGAAVPLAVSVALTVRDYAPAVLRVEVETRTVDLVDDVVPDDDEDALPVSEVRRNNGITIRITRPADLAQLLGAAPPKRARDDGHEVGDPEGGEKQQQQQQQQQQDQRRKKKKRRKGQKQG